MGFTSWYQSFTYKSPGTNGVLFWGASGRTSTRIEKATWASGESCCCRRLCSVARAGEAAEEATFTTSSSSSGKDDIEDLSAGLTEGVVVGERGVAATEAGSATSEGGVARIVKVERGGATSPTVQAPS